MGSEIPLVPFRIFDAVVAVAVKLILGLAHDLGAGLLRALVVRVDVVDVDIDALRLAAELRSSTAPNMITPSLSCTSA